MRILYHHRTKSRDGQYVHISELQAALKRRGHEIDEVAPASGEEVEFGGESRSLSRIASLIPKRGLREILEWGYNAVAYRGLVRAIKRRRPDMIYERYALGNLAGIWAAKKFGLPLIQEVNAPLAWERAKFGGLTFPGMAQKLESKILRRSDRVIAVTEVMRQILIEEGADPQRCLVVPNGVDLNRFQQSRDVIEAKQALGLRDRLVLGFTGFAREWHRLDRVVDLLAHESSRRAKAHLLVVGDGPVREEVLAQAKRLGIEKSVTWCGVVARDLLDQYLAAFDIALQPAVVMYASPLKLFEYMAMGKAIIAPNTPNIREVLEHDKDAFLFPEEDDQAFEAGLSYLIENEGKRGEYGRAARSKIETVPYTWDRNAEIVEELYEAIVREKSPGPPQ